MVQRRRGARGRRQESIRELVESRNQRRWPDRTRSTSTLKELGDKVPGEKRAKIESALSDLRTALKGDDKEQIDRKAEALAQVAGKPRAGGRRGRGVVRRPKGRAAPAGGEQAAGNKDDVVDAEFEEVEGQGSERVLRPQRR